MTHKNAVPARKPTTESAPLPKWARWEIIRMAQTAAACISFDHPKRDAIMQAIAQLCKRQKVGLPKNWDQAGPTDAVASLKGASAKTIKKVR